MTPPFLIAGITPFLAAANSSYPQLSERDLQAALAYAAEVLSHEMVWPLAS